MVTYILQLYTVGTIYVRLDPLDKAGRNFASVNTKSTIMLIIYKIHEAEKGQAAYDTSHITACLRGRGQCNEATMLHCGNVSTCQ